MRDQIRHNIRACDPLLQMLYVSGINSLKRLREVVLQVIIKGFLIGRFHGMLLLQ